MFSLALRVRCPTYIIHGTNDEIVPFSHGEVLYNMLPAEYKYPPFWAEKMGHNNIELEMPTAFVKRLQRFFIYVLRNSKSKPVTQLSKEILNRNHAHNEKMIFSQKTQRRNRQEVNHTKSNKASRGRSKIRKRNERSKTFHQVPCDERLPSITRGHSVSSTVTINNDEVECTPRYRDSCNPTGRL